MLITIRHLRDLIARKILAISDIETAASNRIATYNPLVRAMASINHDSNMDAFEYNHIFSSTPNVLHSRFLFGVPTIVKDVFLTKDLPTSAGSLRYAGLFNTVDSPLIGLLDDHGALIMGKASVPEFALDVQTFNDLTGICGNPWNLDFTAGGSSGGVAAAVSLAFAHAGIGSDLAGSLRIPASYCGISSLKPTEGRVSTLGHFPPFNSEKLVKKMMQINGYEKSSFLLTESSYGKSPNDIIEVRDEGYYECLTVGPMARTVDDLIYQAKVLFTPKTEYAERLPNFKLPSSYLRNVNVAVTPQLDFIPTDKRIVESIANFEEILTNSGYEVEEKILDKELYKEMKTLYNWFGQRFIKLVEEEKDVSNSNMELKTRQRKIVMNKFEELFDSIDFWIFPVTPAMPFRHNLYHEPIEINGQMVPYWKATISYTIPFSLTGNPVLTFPITIKDGFPIGIQIVAPKWHDERLLQFGRQLERSRGLLPQPSLLDNIPPEEPDPFFRGD